MLEVIEYFQIITMFLILTVTEFYCYWKAEMWKLVGEMVHEENQDIPLWGLPKDMPIIEQEVEYEPIKYETSQITEEHEKFFELLNKDIEVAILEEDCTNSSSENTDVTHSEEKELNTPTISVDDSVAIINKATGEKSEEIDNTSRLKNYNIESVVSVKPAKIKDHLQGEQLWTVEVVGEEQGYLHVSDGTARAWVDANEFGQFFKGDILNLIVERKGDHVQIIEMDLLQRKSQDFIIYDEEEEWLYEEAI